MVTDLYLSEELMVIGLDFFMGEGAKFGPIELPQAMLRVYQPACIVPRAVLRLLQECIKTYNADPNTVDRYAVLREGNLLLYTGHATKGRSELNLVIIKEQLAAVEQHQDIV